MEKKSDISNGFQENEPKCDDAHQVMDTLFDESEFKPYDPSQDPIFPPELEVWY